MKFSKKFFLVGLALAGIAGGITYLLWGGIEKNIVYFVTPSELLAKGRAAVGNPVRLGGVVLAGSVTHHDGLISFAVSDDQQEVAVVTTKAPPQMFQEGIGVVVEGALRSDGKFAAERLMVKHGNEYRPPEAGEMPREIYKSLNVLN